MYVTITMYETLYVYYYVCWYVSMITIIVWK